MEFTILDYHILNLLAENSMATEHIIKSRLYQNINNRKHLLVRLEILSQQGLIKTNGGVTYSLSSLGMVIMGKKPAEPQHLEIIKSRGLPLKLTLSYIEQLRENNRQRSIAVAKSVPVKPLARVASTKSSSQEDATKAKSRLATRELTALHEKVKRQIGTKPAARNVEKAVQKQDEARLSSLQPENTTTQSSVPAKSVATPAQSPKATTAQSPKATTAKNKSPDNDNPAQANVVHPSNQGSENVPLKEIKNADIYCLTKSEKLVIQLVKAFHSTPKSRLVEQATLQGALFSKEDIDVAVTSLLTRKLIRCENDERLTLVEGASFALGMNDDSQRRDNNETDIFNLNRRERIVIEMAMQHKREVVQLRNIEETLRLCGEDVTKNDVDEIVKSLTKKQAIELKPNKTYYLTHLLTLAAGMKAYSSKRHDKSINAFKKPALFDFLKPGAPKVKKRTVKEKQTSPKSSRKVSPVKSADDTLAKHDAESVKNAASSTPPQPKSNTMSESKKTVQQELSSLREKLAKPDFKVEDLDDKVALLKELSSILPEDAKRTRDLMASIVDDLNKGA